MFGYFSRWIRLRRKRILREKITLALLQNPNYTPDFRSWKTDRNPEFALPTYTPHLVDRIAKYIDRGSRMGLVRLKPPQNEPDNCADNG